MGRLIDADELIEYLKKYHAMSRGVIADVEHFPTALDIDKVVEKLKERASQSCAVLFAAGIEEAISIIKAGEQDD